MKLFLFWVSVIFGTSCFSGDLTITKLEYPQAIKAGDLFRLTVTADAPAGSNIQYSFNGQTQTSPPDLKIFAAKAFANQYSKITDDNFVTAGSDYHSLLAVPFPQDGKTYAVWARVADGNVCLRNDKKELKWNWGKYAEPRWVHFGNFDQTAAGDKISLMAEKAPYAKVDKILLTTAMSDQFRPAGDYQSPNVFTWQTDPSSVGKYEFTVKVTSGDKSAEQKIKVEVTAPDKTAATARFAPNEAVQLAFGALNQDIKKYPLFDFSGDKFEQILAQKPFGLVFDKGNFIALKSTSYPDLPQTVTVPVNQPAAGLVFLLSEYWQGDVGNEMAYLEVVYQNGEKVKIPLREEYELCGSLRVPSPMNALYLGTLNSDGIEFNLTLVPFVSPKPEQVIKEVVFSNLRMTVSKEENKLIPLNVTANSSQFLLGVQLIKQPQTLQKLAAMAKADDGKTSNTSFVTIDFSKKEGVIHPYVFSTNETDVMSADNAKFDEYLAKMKYVDCKLYRFHSGWSLEKVYPDQLTNPHYEALLNAIRKVKGANPAWDVMMCFNSIPKYVDPKTPAGRQLFADLCADLVREINVKNKLNVKYWEIYNEVYFKKIDEDRALWQMYNLAAEKMRKVDPSIKIGGYAPCWPVFGNIRDFYQNCHDQTDFVSYHKYLTGTVTTPDEYIMAKTNSFGTDAAKVRAIVEEITPGKPVELALTEYNINFNWNPHDPRQATNVGAVWFASVLYHLIKNNVEIAQTWHSRSGGTFGLFSPENEVRPPAQLFALCNRYIAGSHYLSQSSDKTVECLAFAGDRRWGMLLINKSAQPKTVKLNLLNLPAKTYDPILPEVESYSISQTGFKSGKVDFADTVKLDGYELILLVVNR